MSAYRLKVLALLRRLRRDQSGNVAMLFGLLVIPLAVSIGLAVDFGRVYNVRSQTQSALDAAALAAGRVAQVNKTDIVNKASAAASAYFNQAKPKDVVIATLQFSPNAGNTAFTVTATSWVRTPFLAVLNSLFPQDSTDGAPANCQGNGHRCIRLISTATAASRRTSPRLSSDEMSLAQVSPKLSQASTSTPRGPSRDHSASSTAPVSEAGTMPTR